jgi:hypothetical protein
MIIGLVGFAGSGKDTVGDMLVEMGFKKDSFAKPLKDAVSIMFGWDRKKLEGTTKEDRAWREVPDEYWSKVLGKPFSPRLALQLMGTEAGRNVFGEPLWTASCLKRIADDAPNDYVVTDVRFKNEIEALHAAGAIIMRINRGPEPNYFMTAYDWNLNHDSSSELPELLKNVHPSERDWIGHPLIKWDIGNNGTLIELKRKIIEIVNLTRAKQLRESIL